MLYAARCTYYFKWRSEPYVSSNGKWRHLDSILYGEPISDDGTEWVEGAVESQMCNAAVFLYNHPSSSDLRRVLVFCESAHACLNFIAILLPSHQGQRILCLNGSFPNVPYPYVFCEGPRFLVTRRKCYKRASWFHVSRGTYTHILYQSIISDCR